jgi:uncharacterized protein (TIGR02646 family)
MKRLRRLQLSPDAEATLLGLAARVHDAATAKSVWKARERARAGADAFLEITSKLAVMASGNKRCMYCEASAGTDIEHFWPKATYHARTFAWSNHLLACSGCNSGCKGDDFPVDPQGFPMLLDPTSDDPREHLEYVPSVGQYEHKSARGAASLAGYGLRRIDLQRSRQRAWTIYQALLVEWDRRMTRGNLADAHEIEDAICVMDHAGVFAELVRYGLSANAKVLVRMGRLRDELVDVLNRRPEIRQWVAW